MKDEGRIKNNTLKLSEYDFDLPKELIAQQPATKRDECRLMVLDKKTGGIEHKQFSDIVNYLSCGDCLVLNNTKVFPARIYGKKKSGGKVEVLFLNDQNSARVGALLKPFLPCGEEIYFPGGLKAVVIEKNSDGENVLEVSGAELNLTLETYGQMPLPPYIKREKINSGKLKEEDKINYQTVYSKNTGSIAAPTAGLHFTDTVIDKLKSKGVKIIEIVLHVGWGTFKPVRDEDITKHKMLPEYYKINRSDIDKIVECRKNKGKVCAVGTTTTRALESVFSEFDSCIISSRLRGEGCIDKKEEFIEGETDIFIYPGYKFKTVDMFLTNLHTPKSTPLLMACAFAGKENIIAAYKIAVDEKYRFYSYGDAMLIS